MMSQPYIKYSNKVMVCLRRIGYKIELFKIQNLRKQRMKTRQIKIQPWNDDSEEDTTYLKKLNTLSNFNSREDHDKLKLKKQYLPQKLFAKLDKNTKVGFMDYAGATMNNFNKTIRSEYRHRITRLIFNQQGNKKYKFQPEFSPARRRIGLLTSHKFLKTPSQSHINRSQQLSPLSYKKQIYYNLTQVTTPLNSIIKNKCLTEQANESIKTPKIKILNKLRQQKIENNVMSRQLSIERKIFMLQSGGTIKYTQRQRQKVSRGKIEKQRQKQKDKDKDKDKEKNKSQSKNKLKQISRWTEKQKEKEEEEEKEKEKKKIKYRQVQDSKKKLKKCRNIIQQMCRVEDEYLKETKKT